MKNISVICISFHIAEHAMRYPFKKEYTVHYHFYLCNESGEQFTSSELDEMNLVQVYNQYRDEHNLPFPEEIRAIRQTYGL